MITSRQDSPPGPSDPAPTSNGQNSITVYRVGELERRMDKLEDAVRESADKMTTAINAVNVTLKGIETTLSEKASNTYVLRWFGLTLLGALGTLGLHILIRSIGS